jgi:galactokinase
MLQCMTESNHKEFVSEQLVRRLQHFLAESEEIIPKAGDALLRGDLEEFGRQADRSQEAAENLLGNQIEETSALQHYGRELGALGACAFGAGFGGSVWALVEEERGEEFLDRWVEKYRQNFPERTALSEFFLTQASSAAFEL